MATLTRKALAAMGIEDAQADEIIGIHTEVVNEIKDERDKYKSEAKDLETAKKELEALKDEMGKGDRSPYKKKYEDEVKAKEALQEEFDTYKADVEAKASRAKKEDAYKAILKDANIPEKHFAKILKYSDIDGLEFDDKGELSNKSELLKSIKEEWGDHIEQTGTTGANVQNPPANGGKGKMTKYEIMQIKDRAERQKAMLENKDLFLQ